ncbi:MAG TPA: FHA domain-containing protein [Polyangia bacterium]
MFIDGLIKTLKAPFEFVRTKVFGVNSIKGGIKGDLNRLKNVGDQYKQAAGQAGNLAQKAKGGAAKAGNGQKKAAKMGLFSKKKKCPSCGEKLHASWDQCPYCGWSEAPAPVAAAPAAGGGGGGKMRTMAIDMGGGGGAVQGSGVGWLVPLDGPQSGELFQLKGRAVVGTAADCDAVMKDPSISGRHAEFMSTSQGFRVNDLGSTNGTYVNDKRVTNSDLIDNDTVRLGRVNFKFKSMS